MPSAATHNIRLLFADLTFCLTSLSLKHSFSHSRGHSLLRESSPLVNIAFDKLTILGSSFSSKLLVMFFHKMYTHCSFPCSLPLGVCIVVSVSLCLSQTGQLNSVVVVLYGQCCESTWSSLHRNIDSQPTHSLLLSMLHREIITWTFSATQYQYN